MIFFKSLMRCTLLGKREQSLLCADEVSCPLEGLDNYIPLLGEFAWHSLTYDATLDSVSEQHFQQVADRIDQLMDKNPSTILEIGAYAHTTGYKLQEKYGAEVTLFDLSESTLRLGRDQVSSKNERVELVVGDFHDLPFTDGYFDVVYIFATLHHSRDYKRVVREIHRVIAPNGLLCVFQEPFKREACFYKFRTNRLGKLTGFEKALESEELLTTVAEPTPGSRDEILFGMIENQEILLQDWIESLCGHGCAPLEVTPHYVGKVGVLGELWLVWSKGNNSFAGLSRRMAKDFCDRLDKVRPTFDRTARGLGFSLPGKNEVKAMFDSLARKIQLLPHDHECSEYHAQAATIFGGALTFIGRMRACTSDVGGSDSNKKHDKFRAGFPVIDGVRITFCENSLRNIRQSNSCISLFGAAEREALRANFPDFQWNFAKQDNGFWALGLIGSDGELVLPKSEQRQLLVLRLNFSLASYGGGPFRLKIHYGDKEFVYPVYQDEAILFRGIVDGRRNRVIVATESLASQPAVPVAGAGAGVKIYYAGAFSLPEFT